MGLRGIPRPGTRRSIRVRDRQRGNIGAPGLIIWQTHGAEPGGVAPPFAAAHALACSRLQRRRSFAEEPKGFVQLIS